MTKVSECLTLSTCIASIRDFVDPHTDVATLKQWIIEDLGGNFSFTLRGIVASVIGFKHTLAFQWLTTTTSLDQYVQQFPRLWSTPSETFCKTFKASPIARALGVRKPRHQATRQHAPTPGHRWVDSKQLICNISSGIISRNKPLWKRNLRKESKCGTSHRERKRAVWGWPSGEEGVPRPYLVLFLFSQNVSSHDPY